MQFMTVGGDVAATFECPTIMKVSGLVVMADEWFERWKRVRLEYEQFTGACCRMVLVLPDGSSVAELPVSTRLDDILYPSRSEVPARCSSVTHLL